MNRWILLIATALAAAVSGEIVTLTDENFEHQTQASSGQTTGKWFIMMGAVWCGYSCTKLKPILEELSEIAKKNNLPLAGDSQGVIHQEKSLNPPVFAGALAASPETNPEFTPRIEHKEFPQF